MAAMIAPRARQFSAKRMECDALPRVESRLQDGSSARFVTKRVRLSNRPGIRLQVLVCAAGPQCAPKLVVR